MKASAFSSLPAASLLPWTAILLVGSALALLAAATLAAATAGRPVVLDDDLARLLGMMTLLKGVLQLLGLGALAWRFRRPVAPAFAGGYLACAWSASAALGVMWQQAYPAFAAVVLHGAAVVLLVLMSRDPDFFAPVRR